MRSSLAAIENWLREPPEWFLNLGVALICGLLGAAVVVGLYAGGMQ